MMLGTPADPLYKLVRRAAYAPKGTKRKRLRELVRARMKQLRRETGR